ncbi:MAG: tRNA threonylcarbamoyladenosine biosynthesis protein TsaE [Chlamydiales bacterium]|nr:tRNA threonylcarbamoyladenosine biosynthesis protein TsaE [Chlamydiales bacterium]
MLASGSKQSNSAEQTSALGAQIARELKPGAIVCFFGDLGAGKTTLIKGIVSALTSTDQERVCSPTFSYLNIYEGGMDVYHFDLYRLEDEEAFLSLGFEEYLFAKGVCCIEWSERISALLPLSAHRITLLHKGEEKREIIYEISER